MFLLFFVTLHILCAVILLFSVVEDKPIHKRGGLHAIGLLLFIELVPPPNTNKTRLNF